VHDVLIPGSDRTTSRIGFGGSRLAGGLSKRHSLTLLETAFDAGIRHFDVAPYYGFGAAESVLGTFLARHRGEITVTTKYGIARPGAASGFLLQLARSIVKPMVVSLPGIRARMVLATQKIKPRPVSYSAEDMSRSLETSLRTLRCERIDIFLLHEVEAHELTSEIRDGLDRAVARDLIGAWGIGSNRGKIDRIVNDVSIMPQVLQFEWSAFSDAPPYYPGAFVITHQALAGAFVRLKEALTDQAHADAWSEIIGADILDNGALSRLMLGAALLTNPRGIVLFSSAHAAHIRNNVAAMHHPEKAAVGRFLSLMSGNRHWLIDQR
jgi:D-threo-aldose 1-dehydrogenase